MRSVEMLGVAYSRVADRPPWPREPHGLFRWQSQFSETISWIHISCLGLAPRQTTTKNPVRMEWLFSASTSRRTWFLRGIADSDGTVNVRNKTVVITSQPNTVLFHKLFKSIDVENSVHQSRGHGYVTIRAIDAVRLGIFNPLLNTHRNAILTKLERARTFQRRWPEWLEERVGALAQEGLSPADIRNKLLDEDKTYVKLRTIRSKIRKRIRSRRRDLDA